jgi:predicted enzyme related to lactoylglutathione lyase
MKATNIAFACYPVASLGKARKFYEEVLGLKPTKTWISSDTSGMVEYDIGPTTLAIGAGADNFKVGEGGAVVAIEVADFEVTVRDLKTKGCNFILEGHDTPICHMAIITDVDSNKIMIHQRKES